MIVFLDEFKGGLFNNDMVDIKFEWGWKDVEVILLGCVNIEVVDWDKLWMLWIFISLLKFRVWLRWLVYVIFYYFIYCYDVYYVEVICLFLFKIMFILVILFFFVLKSFMFLCWIDKLGRLVFYERIDVCWYCWRLNNCIILFVCLLIIRFFDIGLVMRVVIGILVLVFSICLMMSYWYLYFIYLF